MDEISYKKICNELLELIYFQTKHIMYEIDVIQISGLG